MSSRISRRAVLRGAGVALTLPWLESLARPARAQSFSAPKRFIAIFLPNGAPELWKPPTVGAGTDWQLSSVLEPLASLKSKVTVLSGLETGSVANADGSATFEPPSRQAGAWLTCEDARALRTALMVPDANGVSVDQMLAAHPSFATKTWLPSLQIGLSSSMSYCDGQPCSLSRSVSWKTQTTPLYKTVDPGQLFNQLTGNGPISASEARLAARKSVLDTVLESAVATRARANSSDQYRIDEFMDSMRTVELKLSAAPPVTSCSPPPSAVFPVVGGTVGYTQDTDQYKKAVHADLMNDLLVFALQCGCTSIASYMLEDEHSGFAYDFVAKRQFGALTSTATAAPCGSWQGAMQGDKDEFASIVHWHVGKVAELCGRLDAIREADGRTLLDNSVVLLGAATHGTSYSAADLPTLLVGGGGDSLKTDQHLALGNRPLRDLHYTLMNGVYGLGVTSYGVNRTGAPLAMIPELLT